MNPIKATVYLSDHQGTPPMDVVYGSDVPIELTVGDVQQFPQKSTAAAYANAFNTQNVYVNQGTVTVTGNKIRFTPDHGFFAVGDNFLVVKVTPDGDTGDGYPFPLIVHCHPNPAWGTIPANPVDIKGYSEQAKASAEQAAAVLEEIKANYPMVETLSNEVKRLRQDLAKAQIGELGQLTIETAVDEYLEKESPIGTEAIKDESITEPKIDRQLMAIISNDNYRPYSVNFDKLSPYASLIDKTDTVEVASYQGFVEYNIGSKRYCAVGIIYKNGESGITVYEDGGASVRSVRGEKYGHVNSLTYCNKDNRLYVGAGSNIDPSGDCYSINAITLDNKSDFTGFSTHTIWYDAEKEYIFAILEGGEVYKWRPEDSPSTRVFVCKMSAGGYTAQNICTIGNYIIYNTWDGNNGCTRLRIYTFDGTYLGSINVSSVYESEEIYTYNGELYLSFNAYDYEIIDEEVGGEERKKKVRRVRRNLAVAKLELYRYVDATLNIKQQTCYVDTDSGLYGDGTENSPVSSFALALMSNAKRIDAKGDCLCATVPYTKNIEIIGHSNNIVALCNSYSVNVRVENATIIGGMNESVTLRNSRLYFKNCTISYEYAKDQSFLINATGCDFVFEGCTFINSGNKYQLFKSSDKGFNSAILHNCAVDYRDITVKNFEDQLFDPYFNVTLSQTNATDYKRFVGIARVFDRVSIDWATIGSGTQDLNDYILGNITESFDSSVTLQNAPSGASGRRYIETKIFGSTNGILQIFISSQGMWIRALTGTNEIQFDSDGACTNNKLSAGQWKKLSVD